MGTVSFHQIKSTGHELFLPISVMELYSADGVLYHSAKQSQLGMNNALTTLALGARVLLSTLALTRAVQCSAMLAVGVAHARTFVCKENRANK